MPDAQDAYPLDPGRYLGLCRINAAATAQSGDGADWPSAYSYLQDALGNAKCGEIWVAAGVYYPDRSTAGGDMDSPMASFRLTTDRALYGGFTGTEDTRTQRNARIYPTILSGDLAQDDLADNQGVTVDATDIQGLNAYHVVSTAGVAQTTILDGFTITAGQALAAAPDDCSGGLCKRANGTPVLTAVTFAGNAALTGGALYNAAAKSVTRTNNNPLGQPCERLRRCAREWRQRRTHPEVRHTGGQRRRRPRQCHPQCRRGSGQTRAQPARPQHRRGALRRNPH